LHDLSPVNLQIQPGHSLNSAVMFGRPPWFDYLSFTSAAASPRRQIKTSARLMRRLLPDSKTLYQGRYSFPSLVGMADNKYKQISWLKFIAHSAPSRG
jgi:hypothetical protein